MEIVMEMLFIEIPTDPTRVPVTYGPYQRIQCIGGRFVCTVYGSKQYDCFAISFAESCVVKTFPSSKTPVPNYPPGSMGSVGGQWKPNRTIPGGPVSGYETRFGIFCAYMWEVYLDMCEQSAIMVQIFQDLDDTHRLLVHTSFLPAAHRKLDNLQAAYERATQVLSDVNIVTGKICG
jgi:hypothetical protein